MAIKTHRALRSTTSRGRSRSPTRSITSTTKAASVSSAPRARGVSEGAERAILRLPQGSDAQGHGARRPQAHVHRHRRARVGDRAINRAARKVQREIIGMLSTSVLGAAIAVETGGASPSFRPWSTLLCSSRAARFRFATSPTSRAQPPGWRRAARARRRRASWRRLSGCAPGSMRGSTRGRSRPRAGQERVASRALGFARPLLDRPTPALDKRLQTDFMPQSAGSSSSLGRTSA